MKKTWISTVVVIVAVAAVAFWVFFDRQRAPEAQIDTTLNAMPAWQVIKEQEPALHQRILDQMAALQKAGEPEQQCADLDAVIEHHLNTLRKQQPQGPYYLFGYSLGGTLAQGIAARLREQGEDVAFLGLLDTWPPETQNWAEKEANGLDPEVLAEIERERQAFIAAQQGQGSSELFNAIEGNYADAVRLLTTAHSARFDGKATLFVAERTRTMDPQVAWAPWVGELEVYSQDCAHVDIISPQAFEKIGPVLKEILG